MAGPPEYGSEVEGCGGGGGSELECGGGGGELEGVVVVS